MNSRPSLLFYCQHSVGLGHLVRSLALAAGLTNRFRVVLLNGGPMPEGFQVPPGVEIVQLPPLGHDDNYQLVSRDRAFTVEQAMQRRVALILDAFNTVKPAAIVIELYPFGRKKFRFELNPLLAAAHALGVNRPVIACSVRDILVGQRPDQAEFEQGAVLQLNQWFDVVLVHADARFARLEETFRPATPLAIPVYYTGFVTDPEPFVGDVDRDHRVLVSAGGGLVGEPLYQAAVDAFPRVHAATGLSMTIVAGPFLPDEAFERLTAVAEKMEGLDVVRFLPNLALEMRRSAACVSQCGYNTAMDIIRCGTPTLVVPYSEGREDEQRQRSDRLERLGALRTLDSRRLADLAESIIGLVTFRPEPLQLSLNGAAYAADILSALVPECDQRVVA